MSNDIMETMKTGGIATTGITYSFLQMPLSEVAALATFIYIVLKIILLLPEFRTKFKRKVIKENTDGDS